MSEGTLTIELDRDILEPGELLTGRYRLETEPADQLRRVELTVFWCSQGKGDEDRAVEFEETRVIPPGEQTDASNGEFSLLLPASPLSYDGMLIKLVWYVQVRCKASRRETLEMQTPFQLGHVASVAEIPA